MAHFSFRGKVVRGTTTTTTTTTGVAMFFGDDADEEEKELPPTPTASLWPSNAADGDVRGANALAGTLDFDAVAIPGDLDWLDGFLRVDEEEEKEEEVDEKQKKKVLRAIDKLDKPGFGLKGVEELLKKERSVAEKQCF